MDDVIGLCEGLRAAFPSVLAPGELAAIGGARCRDRRATVAPPDRGDARKKNALLQLLYKGG